MRTTNLKHVRMRTISIGALLFCVGCLVMAPAVAAQNSARPIVNKIEADPLHQLNNSIRALVRRVSPSVVQVMVTGYGPVEGSHITTGLTLERQQSLGSGVIVDPEGYIVTNAHVIRGAHRVLVNIPGEANDESPEQTLVSSRCRTVEARIVGSDSEIDLALLKVEVSGLPALPFGDYDRLRKGEVVLALGSPEGLQDSVTMGVVSSAARPTALWSTYRAMRRLIPAAVVAH